MGCKEGKVARVIFCRFLEGEDLLEAIAKRAGQNKVESGFFFVIGTLKKATLGFYREGKYVPIKVVGPVEITSCIGNLSINEKNELVVHAHVTVSNDKGEVLGGHLLSGCIIGVTGELVLVEALDAKLLRKFDEKTKLSLWAFED